MANQKVDLTVLGFSVLPLELRQSVENISDLPWERWGGQLALGTLLGLALGFTIKKAIKFLLIACGLIVILLLVLNELDFIVIDWEIIENSFNTFMEEQGGVHGLFQRFLTWAGESIPVVGSVTVGFVIGYRLG